MGAETFVFALRHLYVYPRIRVAYTYIPKNACTSLKWTLGTAQGWLDDQHTSAHEMTVRWWLRGLASWPAAEVKIVVVRDPWDRLLSGYLQRFLDPSDAVADRAWDRGLSRRLAPGSTRDDVCFADFLEYLAGTASRELNEHWRPQSDFLLGSYTHLVRFEHLAEDTAFLAERGIPAVTRRGHATSVHHRDLGSGWGWQKARRLRRLRSRRGVLPGRESMYDEYLHGLVAERYAEDITLFEQVNRPDGAAQPVSARVRPR